MRGRIMILTDARYRAKEIARMLNLRQKNVEYNIARARRQIMDSTDSFFGIAPFRENV
jgi:DNA-directed RNA polymerase specialized sigma24 family protein